MSTVLVTGGAGFIGSNLVQRLLEDETMFVTCVDNFDSFYDAEIKRKNVSTFISHPRFELCEMDINDRQGLEKNLTRHYDVIIHLAALAGVRESLKAPYTYMRVNVGGTLSMLEFARARQIPQFIFGSSRSIYGSNPKKVWSETDVPMPISPYAASKLSAETLGFTYSHLYGIRFLAMRFFTVFGPGQRPDLVIHKFTHHIATGKEITVFGDGSSYRDYTYVEDITGALIAAIDYRKTNFEVINVGSKNTTTLNQLILKIEKLVSRKAVIRYSPMPQGDVFKTHGDITKAGELLGYLPRFTIDQGLKNFVRWFGQAHSTSPLLNHI